MGALHNLRLRWFPLRIVDRDFEILRFIYISRGVCRSYWECDWKFPGTGTVIAISLPGDEDGPTPQARQFYLGLAARFGEILEILRPELKKVFREWIHSELPSDTFSQLELSGFDLEDPGGDPRRWNVSFNGRDRRYLRSI